MSRPKKQQPVDNLTIPSLSCEPVEINRMKTSEKDIDRLIGSINEYLGCYIIMGYTPDGNAVTRVKATSQLEADSLGTLMHKFMLSQNEE